MIAPDGRRYDNRMEFLEVTPSERLVLDHGKDIDDDPNQTLDKLDGDLQTMTERDDGDDDLTRWRDMVTINTHQAVRDGEQLAALANTVVSNYQKHGKIVRTDSKPRTPQRPAEHFIAAILGNPGLLEAVFARVVLIDGVAAVAVYSHRIYGKEAAASMGEWLKANGPSIEKTLMAWDTIPPLAALRSLPQSQ